MTCDKFRQMLDNYENLSENEKLILTAHTAYCKDCKSELDFMLSILETAKSLPKIEPPKDFIYKLNASIDLEEVRQRRVERSKRKLLRANWKHYGSLAACLLLIAIIGTNGKSFVSRINETNDDIIITETVSSDENTDKNADIIISEPLMTPDVPANTENVVFSDASSAQIPDKTPNSTYYPVQSKAVSKNVTPNPAETPKQTESVNPVKNTTPSPEAPTSSPVSEPYTIAKEEYRIPIESVPYGNDSDEAEREKSSNGYSLAEEKATLALGMYTPIDKDGNPTDFEFDESKAAVVPSSSSILVSSKDEEKVKSLMNQYITGNYGIYYMTTESRLNEFFEEMDKEGINYEKFINNSVEKVSFKLVVIS